MKVYFYVEGPSDEKALYALFSSWRVALRSRNVSLSIMNLRNKSQFLRKIGARAAQQCNRPVMAVFPFVPCL